MDFAEWEQIKENIQPLKGGRKLDQLAQALNPINKEQLDKERQEFEIELRTYQGDDPLDVWLRYINWTEQNFLSGGKNSKLFTLIEKCLAEFHASAEYRDDPRYLDIWLRYAEGSPNPFEIFAAMEQKHIGGSHAKLYIRWAWHLEMENKFKKATALYQKALEKGAQPIGDIIEAKEKFELRVAKMSLQQVAEDSQAAEYLSQPPQPQRRILGDLRVGPNTFRTASSRLPLEEKENGRLEVRRVAAPVQTPLTVLDDWGASAAPLLHHPNHPMLQPRAERHRENELKPGKWTKTAGPKLQLHKTAAKKMSFEIHQDYAPSPIKAEQGQGQFWNVLKSIKQLEKVPLAILDDYNPKIKPMYPEHLMYIGTEEFSFEELKAMKYLAKMKEEVARKLLEEQAANEKIVNSSSSKESSIPGTVEENRTKVIEASEPVEEPAAGFGPQDGSPDSIIPDLEAGVEFVVFEDPSEDEDKENRAPEGFEAPATRRTCCGILVPTKDILTKPLEQEGEDGESEEECLATPLGGSPAACLFPTLTACLNHPLSVIPEHSDEEQHT